jgi:plasmid stability protein
MVRNNEEHTKFSALLPKSHVRDLFRMAESHDRSVSAEVRDAVRAYLDPGGSSSSFSRSGVDGGRQEGDGPLSPLPSSASTPREKP